MTRALLPIFATLTGCGGLLTPGFEADLTEVCAANYVGGAGDLDLYAADVDATVSMWVSLEGVLDVLEDDEAVDDSLTVGDGLSVRVTTGRNLRPPCSDLAVNEVQRGHYEASAGTADVDLEPWDDNGAPTWLATVTLTGLVLEPEDGGDSVELPSFTFDAVEIWER
ncbi:MAG: hypothetical protein ABIO70_00475 [Pseudomonadota bacterium]